MALPNEPHTRSEMYLNNIATGSGDIPTEPHTREEMYLDYIARNGGGGSSGGGVLNVTVTNRTLNKTYSEIETAYLSGTQIIIYAHLDATEDNPEMDTYSSVSEVGSFVQSDQTMYLVLSWFGDNVQLYFAPSKSDYPYAQQV